VATVQVTYAAPHHLVADGAFGGVRATRAGDAWAARQGRAQQPVGVLLGMPSRRVPGLTAQDA
jgi:tRNA-2-methylthio-N6-dimethylallyladenosine synthase